MRKTPSYQYRLRNLTNFALCAGLSLTLLPLSALAQEDKERDKSENREGEEKERERKDGERERDVDREHDERERDSDRKKVSDRKSDGDREGKKNRESDRVRFPKSLAGFSGQVGLVVEKKGDGPSLIAKVHKVHEVWKNNKADKPKELEGHMIRIVPGRHKNDAGKMQQIPLHQAFIRAFPAKEDGRFEIRHLEGNYFAILELNERQRKFARSRQDDRKREDEDHDRSEKKESEHDRAEKKDRDHKEDVSALERIKKLEAELERLKADLRKRD
jgi:hypothetical protein